MTKSNNTNSADGMPVLVFKDSPTIECWLLDGEYYVYGVTLSGDPRVCPSRGMAEDVAAGGLG